MNTYLKALFEKYNVSDRNKSEILQIWALLPDDKRKNLLNNFATLALRLKKIEEEINAEKEILLWMAIKRIEKTFMENKRKGAREEINALKSEM